MARAAYTSGRASRNHFIIMHGLFLFWFPAGILPEQTFSAANENLLVYMQASISAEGTHPTTQTTQYGSGKQAPLAASFQTATQPPLRLSHGVNCQGKQISAQTPLITGRNWYFNNLSAS